MASDPSSSPSLSPSRAPSEPPKDEWHVAVVICFFLGVGFLLPWNAFITAIDYFSMLYPTRHVDALFANAYMLTCLAATSLLIVFARHVSAATRVGWGFMAYAMLVAVVPLLDTLTVAQHSSGGTSSSSAATTTTSSSGDSSGDNSGGSLRVVQGSDVSLALTVGVVACSGLLDAVVQGSLFGLTAQLPPCYTQAVVAGTAASGLYVSVLRVITKAILPSTVEGLRRSANIYFTVSALMLLACTFCFRYLLRLPVVRHYTTHKVTCVVLAHDDSAAAASCAAAGALGDADPEQQHKVKGSTADSADAILGEDQSSEPLLAAAEASMASDASAFNSQPDFEMNSVSATSSSSNSSRSSNMTTATRWRQLVVLWHIWPYTASLALIYVITLSLFPGFISEIRSTWIGADWYPVILITTFNVCDLLGKTAPAVVPVLSLPVLAGSVVARVLFYPLFAACVSPRSWMNWEPFVVLATAALGFSNGLLTALLMMAAPTAAPEGGAEDAGLLMVLFLVLGLTVGAAVTWVVLSLIGGSGGL